MKKQADKSVQETCFGFAATSVRIQPIGRKPMKVTTAPSAIHGTGGFAIEAIPRGDVVLVMDDSQVLDDESPSGEDIGENAVHMDWLPDGTAVIQAEPERFINHSCDPNVFVYSVNRVRFVVAVRDIPAGSEVCYDYSINAIGGDVWTCHCGADSCRGRHECDFFSLPTTRQLEYLPILDPWFARTHEDRILALLNKGLNGPVGGYA